jgi:uncharacterized protein with NRDE domain
MCLIVVAVGATPRYPFVVAANRDEQHARLAARAQWWPEPQRLLGGRDLKAGGAWLAVDRRGRFAAVTNVREAAPRPGLRSRGELVTEFLAGAESAEQYAARATRDGAHYGAFNLLVHDGGELWLASNRGAAQALGPGLHSFSNAPAGVEWPKTASARAGVERLLAQSPLVEPLFALLAERDESGTLEQRYQRTHFVVGSTYGTRCSTVVLVNATGTATFAERAFDATGALTGEVRESFELVR